MDSVAPNSNTSKVFDALTAAHVFVFWEKQEKASKGQLDLFSPSRGSAKVGGTSNVNTSMDEQTLVRGTLDGDSLMRVEK